MTWALIAGALGVGAIAGWLLRHFHLTPGFSHDTTLFFKRSGDKLKFYTLPTLIGTLLVSIAVLNVALDSVSNFSAIEERGEYVGPRQYQLFQIKIMLAAVTTWYAFISPAWQNARKKQEEAENGHKEGA